MLNVIVILIEFRQLADLITFVIWYEIIYHQKYQQYLDKIEEKLIV